MNKLIRLVTVLMVMLNLIACSNKREKATQIMLSELEKRYGEEFVINAVGGSWGTHDDTTIKAYASTISNPEQEFLVTIKKDLSEVKDRYMDIILSRKLTTELEEKFSGLYSDLYISVDLTDEETVDGQPDVNFKTYCESHPFLSYVISLYIKSDEDSFNKELEAEKIIELLKRYEELGYKDTIFNFYYLKEDVYQCIESELPNIFIKYDYYVNQDKSVNYYEVNTKEIKKINIKNIVNNFKF